MGENGNLLILQLNVIERKLTIKNLKYFGEILFEIWIHSKIRKKYRRDLKKTEIFQGNAVMYKTSFTNLVTHQVLSLAL